MSTPLTPADAVRDAVVACATAVSRALPLPGGLTVDTPLSATLPDDRFLPGTQSRAVSATVEGALNGSLVLMLSGPLASALENGPLGPQVLTAALDPVFVDVRDTLEMLAGGGVQLVAAREVDPQVALVGRGPDAAFAAVRLLSDGAPEATVTLLVTPGTESALTDAAAGSQDPGANGGLQFEPFVPAPRGGSGRDRSLDLLHDVQMGVTAELGRTRMTVRDLLALTPGSVVELDRAAGSPIDVLVNGTLIARGEVVVIDEEFGIRIVEIIGANSTAPRR